MAQGLNRQYRRELKRQEKARQKRVERALEKRQRVRGRWQQRRREAAAQLNPRAWLLRPYKSTDMLLLFLLLWALRWVAFRITGEAAVQSATGFSWALLIAEGAFALITLAYVVGLAREGFEWSGPPGRRLPVAAVWAGGLLSGLAAYTGGRVLTAILAASLSGDVTPAEAGLAPPLGLADLAGMAPAAAALAALAYVIAAPLADELFYRRILGRIFLRNRMSERWTMVSCALLSTLGAAGVLPLPAAAVAGLLFSYLWVRSQSTGMVVIAHVVLAALLLGLG